MHVGYISPFFVSEMGSNEPGESQPTDLPPPPPIPADVVPLRLDGGVSETVPKVSKPKRVPMARNGTGSKGQKIQLLTNHFKVGFSNVEGYFYHYCVTLFYEDGRPVDGKGIGSELAGKYFSYDGEKSLFTVGPLPSNKLEFTVVLEEASSNRTAANGNANGSHGGGGSPNETDRKRSRRPFQSKSFKVEISFAAKIPMQAIANALRAQENENSQEALRVLDIVLRQHAASKTSFFHNEPRNFVDLGGGVLGCRGFHSSFRTTQGGLSLNIDVSTTMIIRPGPVVDFLLGNQNVNHPNQIKWDKAKRTLKNLRVKFGPSNSEYKITGLRFTLKSKGADVDSGTVELTVYDYFVNHRHTELEYSADYPCINVGKPKRPTYIPVELCSLVSLQRYTKALSTLQRSSLVEKSRQKPQERMRALSDVLKISNYDNDPMLKSSGVTISSQFTQIEGRVLTAPKLNVGNGEDFCPHNGRWNFNNKKLVEPTKISRWAVVCFSARCNIPSLLQNLTRCGKQKGIAIDEPFDVFEENPQHRRSPAYVRVDHMFAQMKAKLPGAPQFLLCILAERKNSDVYGPWKRKCLTEFGVVTQCIAPTKVNDQYVTNVLLKINAKLGGMNSYLSVERSPASIVGRAPTIILGMDVSHGSPGQSDVPSIAAVVSSREWPLISKYRASVRTQSPKVQMIDSLFKNVSDTEDEGIVRELLLDFYTSSRKQKPDQIIIFRDGVSESQFNQVFNIELDQIIEACKFLDDKWNPKFTVIIAQKNHHTKFFQNGSPDNVPPGTVIDKQICHTRNNDFYICSHAGMIGTTRPTHYHVLMDEIGFTADDMQELVHSLSYVVPKKHYCDICCCPCVLCTSCCSSDATVSQV
ncbi:hypothetical protein MKX01_032788 [Papaver californicum]|nr:hypothetical protein MKX01_032788 [Papaver californicum]